MSSRPRRFVPARLVALATLPFALAVGSPANAAGAEKSPAAKPATAIMEIEGLPRWHLPAQHTVDLVMSHDGRKMVMSRAVDGPRMRSEMNFDGHKMIMLERPEDGGAIYQIMPEQKTAMKITPRNFAEDGEPAAEEAPAVHVEKLGAETLDGIKTGKYRIESEGHSILAWFDAASGQPLRMEGEGSVVEWKNFKPVAPPAGAFELPKGYQVIDMDEQMKQMRKMGVGAGMMGGAMGGMGSGMGAGMGSGIGSAFGGPIGSMVGGYIGGQVGGWVGHKAADAVTPGPSSK